MRFNDKQRDDLARFFSAVAIAAVIGFGTSFAAGSSIDWPRRTALLVVTIGSLLIGLFFRKESDNA
jgi:type IV secretory pathway VirB2 component (pilin)